MNAACARVNEDPIPPPTDRTSIPPQPEGNILRRLARHPDGRFQNVAKRFDAPGRLRG